ncbi:MAG TPA: transaldolase [Candidatus Binatia bacterium]|jgi:transaldolase|nr:transaldolase [Candidatus Binatia bacterium]
MNPLLRLTACGQSYWLDNLTRGMIKTGALRKRVAEEGLRGITSNPSTFHKAIAKSSDYDAQIHQLLTEKRPLPDVYERLVVSDIQDACDILRPVYDASDGVDGFMSLEVSPHLAHDTEGTMAEARHLFTKVGRPNVFIKIPGTAAGVPAIEQMLYEGININITLLFSVPRYETVAEAYLKALERRVAAAKPVQNVASVASFFLSRIDVLVDQLLSHRIRPESRRDGSPRPEQLLGKGATANAKLAYQSFKKIFSGNRWQALERKGARVQRPLWASTGTKNPEYRDVRYVEPLIGPHTVSTMPEDTIAAFADHGVVRENSVEADLEEARQIFQALDTVGVNFDCVVWQLENEGVQKFIEPFDELMRALQGKCQQFLGDKAGG